MPAIKLIGFSGEVPRAQPTQLSPTGAQLAVNARLDDGALKPIRRTRLVRRFSGVPSGTIKTIYQHQGEWLWWGQQVNAAPGPVAQDRLYYTGNGKPKMRVGGKVYDLAVPTPPAPLKLAVSGTGDTSNLITRIYAYTWVTDFAEESKLSPASPDVDWSAGQIVTLSGFAKPPEGRGITRQRIYRSQTSAAGITTFNFLAERDASNEDFLDTIAPDEFAEVAPSADYDPPPDTLSGLIALPNGLMAAFDGKRLYFCEPWLPHAWPEKYVLTTDFNIVALGAFGTSVVVMTEGNPYLVSGSQPDTMAMERTELNLPCINARGVVDLGYAVAYPSHDGLVVMSSSGPSVATASLFTRDSWLALNPQSFVAGQFSGRYFASYESFDQGEARSGSILIDQSPSSPFVLRWAVKADAVHYDLPTSTLFVLDDVEVHEVDAPGQKRDVMKWRSKRFVMQPYQESYSCIQVLPVAVKTVAQKRADDAARAAATKRNQEKMSAPLGGAMGGAAFGVLVVNGDGLEVIPQDEQIAVRIFMDGELVATKTRLNVIERLPAGFRGQVMEIEIEGTAEIAQVVLATSMDELAQAVQV